VELLDHLGSDRDLDDQHAVARADVGDRRDHLQRPTYGASASVSRCSGSGSGISTSR
jgi:hypothetical protein